MKMQCEAVYPNIYKCVSDYRKFYHDRFWTFKDTLQKKQDSIRLECIERSTIQIQFNR